MRVGKWIADGWTGPLDFYSFKCGKHGNVVNYPDGFRDQLQCPICLLEKRAALDGETILERAMRLRKKARERYTNKLSEQAIVQLAYVENNDIFDKDVSLEPTDYTIIAKAKIAEMEDIISCHRKNFITTMEKTANRIESLENEVKKLRDELKKAPE